MKYWIDKAGKHNHGNPWFVFTVVDYHTYSHETGAQCDKMTIGIPYHNKHSAYHNYSKSNWPGYGDLEQYPEAWDEWLSYTNVQRKDHLNKFRRNTLLNTNEMIAWHKQQIANAFVTFPQATTTCCDTVKTNTKEENMNEFYTERSALQTAASKAFYAKETEAMKHFHLTPDKPKTVREALEWVEKKHYKALDDKALDRRLDDYEDPLDHIEFRKHPADPDGYSAARDKTEKAYKAVRLDIDVLPPTEALGKFRTFESTVYH